MRSPEPIEPVKRSKDDSEQLVRRQDSSRWQDTAREVWEHLDSLKKLDNKPSAKQLEDQLSELIEKFNNPPPATHQGESSTWSPKQFEQIEPLSDEPPRPRFKRDIQPLDKQPLDKQASDKQATDKKAPEKLPTVFTTKYDAKEAAAAIEKLGDPEYADREAATKLLKSMGPEALAQLKKARDTNGNPETRNRATECINYIDFNQRKETQEQLIANAPKVLSDYAKILEVAAGAKMDYDYRREPYLSFGNPKGVISPEEQKNFDELIKKLDMIDFQSDAFKNSSLEGVQKYWLERFANEGRLYYAEALSRSDKPEDKAKAVKLLVEQMDRGKDVDYLDVPETLLRLDADKDPVLMKRFNDHGITDEKMERARKNQQNK
jgi:hypothetical protein